jgi:predicted nucleic acid-binding protein
VITLDTSALLALIDAADRDHPRCVGALEAESPPYVVPAGILGEIGYLLEVKLGTAAVVDFAGDLATGAFALDCGDRDFRRVAELVRRYEDLQLGFADASVIACAERCGGRVMTLDLRDFGPVARERTIELVLT